MNGRRGKRMRSRLSPDGVHSMGKAIVDDRPHRLSLPSSAGACSRICTVLLSSALHQTASPSPLLISSPSPARPHDASRRSRRPSGFKRNCSRRRIYLHRAAMRCATLAPSGTSMTPHHPLLAPCGREERTGKKIEIGTSPVQETMSTRTWCSPMSIFFLTSLR